MAAKVFSIPELRSKILKTRRNLIKRDVIERTDWLRVCLLKRLSVDFLTEFQDNVMWDLISQHQQMDLDFITRFAHKINWALAIEYQYSLQMVYPHLVLWAHDTQP